jgi:hypothetical protein
MLFLELLWEVLFDMMIYLLGGFIALVDEFTAPFETWDMKLLALMLACAAVGGFAIYMK